MHTISTHKRLLATMLAAAMPLLAMTAVTAPAQAQQYATPAERGYQPIIRGFNVDEVSRLAPGVELNFDVYGTPGGRVYLQIAGAARGVQLTETEPGVYEGVYVIGGRDRVTGSSAVTANLRVGNQVTSGVLRESLLRSVGRHDAPRRGDLAVVPRIERFDVRGISDLRPGNEIDFMLRGTPGAKVDMSIAGTRGVFFLPEVRPGEYEGSYVIRRGDRLDRGTAVTANLRLNGRVTTATLNKPLQLVGAVTPPPPPPGREVRYCSNCATVEAINVVEVKGDGNYIGTIGGGVLGALAGSQVGGGNGRTAAEVAGALGGAYVGRNIDRQNDRQTRHFEVVIRYANGGTQTVQYANDPGLRVGEKVRYSDGALTRDN